MAYDSTHTGDEVTQRVTAIKSGGSKGQALVKQSNADFDIAWTELDMAFNGVTPVDGHTVPDNAIYVEVSNNRLRFKDSLGAIYSVGLVGFTIPTVEWEDGSSIKWEDGTDMEWDS